MVTYPVRKIINIYQSQSSLVCFRNITHHFRKPFSRRIVDQFSQYFFLVYTRSGRHIFIQFFPRCGVISRIRSNSYFPDKTALASLEFHQSQNSKHRNFCQFEDLFLFPPQNETNDNFLYNTHTHSHIFLYLSICRLCLPL